MDLPDRVEAALAKPKSDLTPADLRLLVAQKVDLEDMVPRALEVLHEHPLIEAQFFPGDLLKTLLEVPADYWSEDQASWSNLHSVLDRLDRTLKMIDETRAQFMKVAS